MRVFFAQKQKSKASRRNAAKCFVTNTPKALLATLVTSNKVRGRRLHNSLTQREERIAADRTRRNSFACGNLKNTARHACGEGSWAPPTHTHGPLLQAVSNGKQGITTALACLFPLSPREKKGTKKKGIFLPRSEQTSFPVNPPSHPHPPKLPVIPVMSFQASEMGGANSSKIQL